MSDLIETWNPAVDGELNEANMRRKLEQRGYRVSRYHYPPGTSFPPHTHGVDKIDGVLQGRFRMSMQGHSLVLTAGDCLAVPKGVVHSAEVVGGETVISLDAVRLD
jgi:quercetin dioxygenase-like cupin family protein